MFTSPLLAEPPTSSIWQSLFSYYAFFAIVIGVIVISISVYFMIRYRRRGDPVFASYHEEEEKVSWKKVLLTLAITGSVLFFVQYQTFLSTGLVTLPPQSKDAIHIKVIGQQWFWTFVYPNGAKIPFNLTVPAGQIIVLNVTSTDVAHSFSISDLSVAVDAIPGRENPLWFNATHVGVHIIRCKELCGVGHAFMFAKLTVVEPSAYAKWYSTLGVGK